MTWNLFPLVIIAVVLFVVLNLAAGLIWVERRLLALWQDRYGPNRVGPFGLGQIVADSVKLFTKEDWVPPFADKPVFILAPAIIVATALISFAVVPSLPGLSLPTSISECCFSSRCPPLAFIALFCQVGLRTINSHSLVESVPPHRCL